ncbi:MAG: triose-phosphate isomerase [Candidatus Moraniibacteriota bacterium]
MKLVIGNLKMNLLSKMERDKYLESLSRSLEGKSFKNVSFVICPPVIHLGVFSKKTSGLGISLGAQNIHEEASGRFTGEISAPMVKDFGAEYVIIGHSERRRYYFEDDEMVNKKIKIALKNNLVPVVCVGETMEERAANEIKYIISAQLAEGLKDIPRTKISQIVIAYEPIWAIGSGQTPTSDEIMEVRILMQKILSDKFGLSLEKMPRFIYGGSVNFKKIKEICIEAGMQGVLVGGESLHPNDFIKIGEILENN